MFNEAKPFSQLLPCQLVKYDLKVKATTTDLNPLLFILYIVLKENNYTAHQHHIPFLFHLSWEPKNFIRSRKPLFISMTKEN